MRDRIRFTFAFVGLFILPLVSGSGPVAATGPSAPTYTLIDLGTLGGGSSGAYGINEGGQVVGESETAAGLTHAFLWEAGTGMQDLGTLGGSFSRAYSINARGQVVGESATFTGIHAFLWEAGTGMRDLLALSGPNSAAWGINARGQVVGTATSWIGRDSLGFLWEASTGIQFLYPLSGRFSAASGINALGQVVGYSSTDVWSLTFHAFLWEAGSGMRDLGTLGDRYTDSYATGINDGGQIVGWAWTAGGTHAVLWEPTLCITPSITSVSATPDVIWPPNHEMVPISVVADADAVCGPPVCTIVSIASDEPTDRISDDTAITGSLTALVRAARSGGSMGRTYTITVKCHDTAGNAATRTTIVRVPHDQGK
jgi:probable HAF family extracellular repeat protein